MTDFVVYEIQQVPDAVVYVVNREVEKVIPVEDVSKRDRGFYIPVKDCHGNITLQYAETSVVETEYLDKEGKEVPFEEAITVITKYYDAKGNIIHRPLQIITRK